jgi:hypothetical protein
MVAQNGGATTCWTVNSADAWGHYQDELFGNGIVTISDFDQASGLMASREAGVGGGTGRSYISSFNAVSHRPANPPATPPGSHARA